MKTKNTSKPDAEAIAAEKVLRDEKIAALRTKVKDGLTITGTASRMDKKTGKKRPSISYYRPPIGLIWDVVELYKTCDKASYIATVVVNAIGNKFKHAQTKCKTDEERLTAAQAYAMKIGLGSSGAAMKKKREAVMGRCVPIIMSGGVEMPKVMQGFFKELASDESPYQDDDSLKAALVGHELMEESEELNAWLIKKS